MGGSCEHGNAPLDSMQGREFLEHVSYYQVLRKNLAPGRELE